MQTIRLSLRGKAVVLMGKNTMMRKAIRGHLENNPALEKWVCCSLHLPLYCRIVTVQLVWCCVVVPPANSKLFPAIPVCLNHLATRDARFQTLKKRYWIEMHWLRLTVILLIGRLLPHIKGNVGFVFTKEDLAEVRDLLLANKVRFAKKLNLVFSLKRSQLSCVATC